MSKFTITIFITTLLFTGSVIALDLEQALTEGYKNNEELKAAQIKFLNAIEQFPQAFSGFMPNVGLQINRQNSKTKYNKKYVNRLGITPRETASTQGILTIEQSLFNGGASIAALKAAQSGFRASRSEYYAGEQKVLLNLITAYLDCVESKEKYDISESRVRTNIQQVKTVEEKLRLGEATAIDIAAARAGLAAAETNKLAAYADFQGKKANFIKVFGIEANDITMPDLPDRLPISLDEFTRKAAKFNPDINSARHNVTVTKALEMVQKGKLLPQVSVKLLSGGTNYNPQEPVIQNINNRIYTTTLSVNIPIYPEGGAQYSRIRSAKNQTRNSVVQLDSAIKQIKAGVVSVWEGFETAKSRIVAANQGVEAAQISYNGIVQEEIVGSKTILDVLDAEQKLYEAKITRVDAYKNSVLASYQMKLLTGELTAKSLKLKVKYFSPEEEFNNLKKKMFIGF
ncbi:TolC family protein [Rickettsia prowazekii]|uniref:OUTER MEMBRANE PROTEIN TOLC (TolC) n=2 Tax=Rickettsia prowazekii TaxID=782 RepID=Q9ZDV0_RICPR|nr:TolC family protein [Rickettsia prowazekii]ADE29736.1 Type I secretion outer membrane protein TolC [Rickettsia prowazekii str. Rp22]AFE49044.1 outer membrane protein tolC precursor [Rickettsia prowazekii str. Chernikova]AFE49890.1 outer membrane protein tolC precursor [Rickettsia prowazekii str. Katsinyian]AFE50734.1 outer membrane protein tolC precursor [Rickettsia prowazekii str. BuV67-CWPP]AFE51574.1 outer membrane protein tolC precursor [Rickettsia prowazekii str. Dachau]